jgi:thiamine pyrophosphokinase
VLLDEHNEVTLLRGPARLAFVPESNEIVSLIPFAEDADDVSTSGLRWVLNGERLRPGDTRGVSNEPVSNEVRVAVGGGALLVARYFPEAGG